MPRRAIRPRRGRKDAFILKAEEMLTAVHAAAMAASDRATKAPTDWQRDAALRVLCRAATTFALLLEASRRHRGTRVLIQNQVSVYDHSLAVPEAIGQPHEPRFTRNDDKQGDALTISAEMHGHIEANTQTVPRAGSERLECV